MNFDEFEKQLKKLIKELVDVSLVRQANIYEDQIEKLKKENQEYKELLEVFRNE